MKFSPFLPLAMLFLVPASPVPAGDQERGVTVQTVTYRSGRDTLRSYLARPAGKGPFPTVVVIHDDFGLTAGVKQQARHLAGKGYLVLAVDLYRGEVPKDIMDAHIYGRGLPDDQVLADLKAAVSYLAGRPDARRDAVGILGFGMGGGYALDAALQDNRLRAVVICYGRLTTDAKLLRPLRASVLGIFAGKDEGITARTIEQFRTAMRRAGKRVADLHVYLSCGHGFLDPRKTIGSPTPPRIVADAWGRIEKYLAAELRR